VHAVTAVQLAAGVLLLIGGAEMLVRGASRLALRFGVPPLVIGLTVVAFGTSSPELAVCLQASAGGRADIALGNVIGSNIFNILLILGASAAVAPLVVARQLLRLDVPVMIAASAVAWLVALDGRVSRFDGAILFSGMIGYILVLIRLTRRDAHPLRGEYADAVAAAAVARSQPAYNVLLVLAGLASLVIGSRLLVGAAVLIAQALGVSELIIGVTIVAMGTSLPELATSVLAAARGERDIAVGNVVGSNILNVLGILGLAAAISPVGIAVAPAALSFDIPVMTAVALACLPVFAYGHRIARWEGLLFLGYYLAYTSYLLLAATHHDALPMFSRLMAVFVLPLTGAGLMVTGWRAFRAPGTPPAGARRAAAPPG
jgi:cation:H+ antiporter